MTLEEARVLRVKAEDEILKVLRDLQAATGLDLAEVQVMMIVDATQTREPQRRPHAVRIDLAV